MRQRLCIDPGQRVRSGWPAENGICGPIRAHGHCLEPILRDGAWLWWREDTEVYDGDFVTVRLRGGDPLERELGIPIRTTKRAVVFDGLWWLDCKDGAGVLTTDHLIIGVVVAAVNDPRPLVNIGFQAPRAHPELAARFFEQAAHRTSLENRTDPYGNVYQTRGPITFGLPQNPFRVALG